MTGLTFRVVNQRGATLVVALIILLVMSLIGLSSMKGSTLQERMAGNARQKTLAKNAAFTAMREAETWLQTNVRNPMQVEDSFDGSCAYCFSAVRLVSAAAASPVNFDVTDPSAWVGKGQAGSAMSTGQVSQQPRYVIEYLGRDIKGVAPNPVQMLDAESEGDADLSPYFFRITAIGWGRDANIYSIVESTFMTGYGAGNFVY